MKKREIEEVSVSETEGLAERADGKTFPGEEKLISFVIPCYNSQDYMDSCIESVLPGGEDTEILIVDDGSTDETPQKADVWAARYPDRIRVIHQENGGHGAAVNTGLANARGLYFKVVDSDDWLDTDALRQVLLRLSRLHQEGNDVDLFLTNYVYEKPSENKRQRMMYTLLFPQERVIGWQDMKRNIRGFSILMHSCIYRRQLLLDCGLELPAHTFYVDNLFVYLPLPHVKTLYYYNADLYRYYIGREGQSVAEQTMVRRIDQQLAVNYRMIDGVDPWAVEEKHLRKYLLSYLETLTVVSSAIGYVSGDPKNIEKVERLWAYIRDKDIRTWRTLRFGILGASMNLPGGTAGRRISVALYRLSQRVMGFN